MDLQLWSGSKGPIIPMEVAWFSTPEEDTAKSQKDQDCVNCVFWLERCCPSCCPLQAKQLISGTIQCSLLVERSMWWEWLQLWATGDWQLHHHNVLMHHISCRVFFVKHQITQVTQPPYSPDLVLCDFWHFRKLKSPLKGKRFQTINEV